MFIPGTTISGPKTCFSIYQPSGNDTTWSCLSLHVPVTIVSEKVHKNLQFLLHKLSRIKARTIVILHDSNSAWTL